jgi:hypothetical protein
MKRDQGHKKSHPTLKHQFNLKMKEVKIKALLNALFPITDFMRN